MAHTWDFTGWTLENLLRLRASWAAIVTSTDEERQALAQCQAALETALQAAYRHLARITEPEEETRHG
jgi:hypothetical protein